MLIRNPKNLRFKEFCSIVKSLGFHLVRQTGSHLLFYHQETGARLNLQPNNQDKGKAKPYQVKQLIKIIEEFNLLESKSATRPKIQS